MTCQQPLEMSHCALVIAHPAHELHVHGFLESHQPSVHVLTDGSGRNDQPRIGATARILDSTGCQPGALFGQLTDRQVYDAILRRDPRPFLGLTKQLADSFVQSGIRFVIGDASEGTVLTHEVCRAMINTAVQIASETTRFPITNLEFNVVGGPFTVGSEVAEMLTLTAPCFQRKINAALNYVEVQKEVTEYLLNHGIEAFRTEKFRAASDPCRFELSDEIPAYERHAHQLARNGIYRQAIVFQDHVVPVFRELHQLANRCAIVGMTQ